MSIFTDFYFILPRPPTPPLLPYTTLFRSLQIFPPGQDRVFDRRVLRRDREGRRHRRFQAPLCRAHEEQARPDRKSTRLNSSHVKISYAVFCLKKKKYPRQPQHTATLHTRL